MARRVLLRKLPDIRHENLPQPGVCLISQVVLDTVVQRMGDAAAAAFFGALHARGALRPTAFAAACVPLCLAWAGLAAVLGRRQQRLHLELAASNKREITLEDG